MTRASNNSVLLGLFQCFNLRYSLYRDKLERGFFFSLDLAEKLTSELEDNVDLACGTGFLRAL